MSSLQYKTGVVLKTSGTVLFYSNDLPRPLYSFFFLSPGIARLNLEKETGKKSIMLTKYHVVLLKASSCGCKILFFSSHILV